MLGSNRLGLKLAGVVALLVLLPAVASAQPAGRGVGAGASGRGFPVGPAANTAASSGPGLTTLNPYGAQVKGLWVTSYGRGSSPSFPLEGVAFKPWARGLFDERQKHDLEPHARCKPSGAVRQFLTPYGVEILEIKELKRLYIFDIGGPHSFREVFMDGRSHPPNVSPTYYGHNIGWWDGDTLVVDSVGYTEGFWFERMGLPHTEAVHVTEYFRRPDERTIDYRFVMEDKLAYDSRVEGTARFNWREGDELFEYMCQQSNYAHDLMVNPEDGEAVGRSSVIAP